MLSLGKVVYVDGATPVCVAPSGLAARPRLWCLGGASYLRHWPPGAPAEHSIRGGLRDPRTPEQEPVTLSKNPSRTEIRFRFGAKDGQEKQLLQEPLSVAPVFERSFLMLYAISSMCLDLEQKDGKGMFRSVGLKGIRLGGRKGLLSLGHDGKDEQLLVLFGEGDPTFAWLTRSNGPSAVQLDPAKAEPEKGSAAGAADRNWVAAVVCHRDGRQKERKKRSRTFGFALLGHAKGDVNQWHCRTYSAEVVPKKAEGEEATIRYSYAEKPFPQLAASFILLANRIEVDNGPVLVDAGDVLVAGTEAQGRPVVIRTGAGEETLSFMVRPPERLEGGGPPWRIVARRASRSNDSRAAGKEREEHLAVQGGLALCEVVGEPTTAVFFARKPGSQRVWDAVGAVTTGGPHKGLWFLAPAPGSKWGAELDGLARMLVPGRRSMLSKAVLRLLPWRRRPELGKGVGFFEIAREGAAGGASATPGATP